MIVVEVVFPSTQDATPFVPLVYFLFYIRRYQTIVLKVDPCAIRICRSFLCEFQLELENPSGPTRLHPCGCQPKQSVI